MHWNNNATRIRRELLVRLVKLMDQGTLEQEVDRIPYEMAPKNQPSVRCCVHHDRAILKLRLIARMGLRIEDIPEEDEYLPLSWYAKKALERRSLEEPVLTVIDEACHACVQTRMFVTNACQGCMARPCMVNCPKKAISIQNGKAVIDNDLCVDCGICTKACSYGAILQIPVPCEAACPVGAIAKDADGKESIDFDKCISCGACMASCPFGAVTDRSQILDVLRVLQEYANNKVQTRPVAALIAPAVMAQFRADTPAILEAIQNLGFDSAWEVAQGAQETASLEAEELEENLEKGGPVLATSCCPAWVEAGEKHLGLHKGHEADDAAMFLSTTPSPMLLTARLIKKTYSDQGKNEPLLVFIGPCVAKRMEAIRSQEVDYVLSSEELGAFLMAREIELSDYYEAEYPETQEKPGTYGRGFAASGGVAQAVLNKLQHHKPEEISVRLVDGLSRETLKDLQKKGPGLGRAGGNPEAKESPCQIIEGMACKGGCVCGPSILVNPKIAANQLKKQK